MRKQLLTHEPNRVSAPPAGELDIPALATALISSEAEGYPVENAFDAHRGPGTSRWVAGVDGQQTLILAFDSPQNLREVVLEVEETAVSRTQELTLAVSNDGGKSYREIVRQEFNFSPPHTVFERESWRLEANAVTHLRLNLNPDKSGRPCRASLTSLALRGA